MATLELPRTGTLVTWTTQGFPPVVGYAGDGHLTARVIDDLASHFGFRVIAVPHLPSGLRSLADLRNGRLFVHERERVGRT